jgi:hypothetical protein
VDRKIRGTDTYGNCRQCEAPLKKGQLAGSNYGKRYCLKCYEMIFKRRIEIEC